MSRFFWKLEGLQSLRLVILANVNECFLTTSNDCSVFAKIVHEALKETKPSREQLANAGILEHILAANADTRDKITTFIDLVLGGIESVCLVHRTALKEVIRDFYLCRQATPCSSFSSTF